MTYKNKPNFAGQPAAAKRFFGDNSRYAIAPVHTRFDDIAWFVWDAEAECDEPYIAETIRICDTKEEALKGFETEYNARQILAS